MIVTGGLTAQDIRDTYLLGIHLGSAWTGPSGDAAIERLLALQIAQAERILGIHLRRWRVITLPEAALLPVTDYDVLGLPIPYVPPIPGQTVYRLTLHEHDIQAVTRLRLLRFFDTQNPPQPVFETMPQAPLAFDAYREQLLIPVVIVDTPSLGLTWAVDYLLGLGMLPPDVEQWIALSTAIQVLALAGAGADVSGGLGGETLRMDGIEESKNYGGGRQMAKGGLYAGPISILEAQLAMIDLSKLRFRYQNTLGDLSTLPPDAVIALPPYEQTVCTPRLAGAVF
jgi:hypothetical protein